MSDRHARIEELFSRAAALPVAERAELLDRECTDDAERREIEGLLAADTGAGSFLECPLPGRLPQVDATALEGPPSLVGQTIGSFRLTRVLGEGGMGVVYEAERVDSDFAQRVAIKFLGEGIRNAEAVRRFEAERRTLARLSHSHIARLIDGGLSEHGWPFLAMEYVDGLPIDAYCRSNALSIERRLDLFRECCEAVSHAHQNLIVHRDLKPANILVDKEGSPKLLDFGVAKLLETESTAISSKTIFRALTPGYASPEDLAGDPSTTASDVYSLGVVLYELLTDRPPFPIRHESVTAIIEERRSTSPPPPSKVGTNRNLDPDLDQVVSKALRFDPIERYQSVAEFSEDIRCVLRGLPVRARPDHWSYRLRKFVSRNRFAVAASGAAVVALLTFAIAATTLSHRADRARQYAERSRLRAEQTNTFLRELLGSVDPTVAEGRDVSVLQDVLERARRRVDDELSGQPLVAADLHRIIGRTYLNMALYAQADSQLHRAVDLESRFAAPGDSTRVESLLLAGQVFEAQSQFDKARSAYGRARRESASARGSSDPLTARSWMRMGNVFRAMAEADSAEAAFQRALRIQREVLPAHHLDLGETLNGYGQFLIHVRPEAAEPVLREAVAIYDASAPPLQRVSPMHNLASFLRRKRKEYAEAETIFREVLAIDQDQLAADHPRIAVVLNNLAGVLEDEGKLAEAEDSYRQALAIQRVRLGPEHLDYGTTCNNLARLLGRRGSFAEADELYGQSVHAYETTLGRDHIWVGIVLGNQARLLEVMGRWDEADAVLRRCLEIRRRVWGEQDWRVAAIEGITGARALQRGDLASAERILTDCLRRLEAELDDDHEQIRYALLRLRDFYETAGRRAELSEIEARLALRSEQP